MTIFDLAYEVDHEKLYNIFLNPALVIDPPKIEVSPETQINVFVHLKRGVLDKVDTTAYELVKLVGYIKKDVTKSESTTSNTHSRSFSTDSCDKGLTFVGTGRVQMPQLIREMSSIDPSKDEFTSKHSMEWKFIFLDQRAPPIIGYMPFEVLGTSGYDYYHFDDLDNIISCHEELMQKGEGKSCYYRFLTKGQQWIWLQSDYYISYHNISSKPDYVVCTHKVVSYVDVIKQNKLNSSNKTTAKCTSATVTLRDLEGAAAVGGSGSVSGVDVSGIEKMPATTTTKSPEIDSSIVWPQRAAKLANYGSMTSAAGLSSNVKRKRYSHTRCNESDYTSDSSSSRHSLMTHLSSQARNRHNLSSQLHQAQQQQQQQQQHSMSTHQQQPHLQHQMQQQQMQSLPHTKLTKMSQQAIGLQLVSSPPTQFAQPTYPMRNPQLMGHTFLEPQQYLAAIPVQPVIAPFPMTPVLSPMNNSSDILPSVMMTQTQTQIQDQLQRKHDELQKMIFQQQDELRRVSEQLLMARYTIIPTYNNPNQNRHFQLGASSIDHHQQQQPQFVNYNYGMNDQLQNTHHDVPMHQQQHQHQQQQQTHQQHPQQQSTQSLQQQMLPRNPPVPDLEQYGHEDIDAFLNAEALQPTLVLPSPSPTTMNPQQQLQPHQQPSAMSMNPHNLGVQQDDSLLSYMHMQTEPTTTSNLHFQMGISDDGSESRGEDVTVAGQNRFNPYQTQSNQLPNDLEILPYQMSQETSQILFNSPHTPGQSQ
ncbi:circadian locomoter output cycles protein kaput isoform X2 [Episyrphus balteatus]|nr:circadian locomoter output cycles protein kaput isoform X2 [Episyrphus balteatus]